MKKTSPSTKNIKAITNKQLDIIRLANWKIAGVIKWGKVCESCGSEEYIQGHHAFPYNSYKILRYDVDNYVPLCRGCHSRLERYKGFIVIYRVLAKRGIKWINKLMKKI